MTIEFGGEVPCAPWSLDQNQKPVPIWGLEISEENLIQGINQTSVEQPRKWPVSSSAAEGGFEERSLWKQNGYQEKGWNHWSVDLVKMCLGRRIRRQHSHPCSTSTSRHFYSWRLYSLLSSMLFFLFICCFFFCIALYFIVNLLSNYFLLLLALNLGWTVIHSRNHFYFCSSPTVMNDSLAVISSNGHYIQ